MNRKQMISMWLGIAAFVVVSLSTKTSYDGGSRDNIVLYTYYGPLIAYLLSICIVTAGLIYTFRDKTPKSK